MSEISNNKENFILRLRDDHIIGFYSSLDLLRQGAKKWIKNLPHKTLFYETYGDDDDCSWHWNYVCISHEDSKDLIIATTANGVQEIWTRSTFEIAKVIANKVVKQLKFECAEIRGKFNDSVLYVAKKETND